LGKAREEKPDLIILDIVMPYMDGGDVARALAQDASTKDIPIIFLTALITKTEESLGIGITTGKHHIIAKPFEDEELLTKVKEALEGDPSKEEE
jgi:CheY-like chemotaxis protein